MTNSFNALALCREIALPLSSGHLTVTSNGITWDVSLLQGRLQYALHSVQSLETLEYHLLKLGHDRAAQSARKLTQADAARRGLGESQAPWIVQAATVLLNEGLLTSPQLTNLLLAVSEDALEYLLWLPQGSSQWQTTPAVPAYPLELDRLSRLSEVLDRLETRQQAWQRLWPLITSPYQQPYCPDPSQLHQAVPGALLSQDVLNMLVKLMQGASLRKLSLFLKQDDLKVAQLLHPFLDKGILALRSPQIPFSTLPPIPPRIERRRRPRKPGGTAPMERSEAAPLINPLMPSQPVYKIVCIDDSPAMLDTIQQYLGSEQFEITTVENPMESLSALFAMKPDLILMDVSMPGINGNRLCQILRRSSVFKDLPIIMVSGNTGVLDKAKAESSGATDYLTKPFTREGLLAIVNTHLNKSVSSRGM